MAVVIKKVSGESSQATSATPGGLASLQQGLGAEAPAQATVVADRTRSGDQIGAAAQAGLAEAARQLGLES